MSSQWWLLRASLLVETRGIVVMPDGYFLWVNILTQSQGMHCPRCALLFCLPYALVKLVLT